MTQTDERPLSDFGQGQRSHRSDDNSRWWWPLLAGAVVVAGVAYAVGRMSAPSADDPEPIVQSGLASDVIEPGALLGPIAGANRYSSDDDMERLDYAWPGQELIAPEPSAGDAVGWQWQLCDVPQSPKTKTMRSTRSRPRWNAGMSTRQPTSGGPRPPRTRLASFV